MEKLQKSDYFRILKEAENSIDTRCLYADRDGKRCRDISVKSHTLQLKGPLKEIAEDNHVLSFLASIADSPTTGQPQKISTRKASIFPGFCERHDSEIFRPIEVDLENFDPETPRNNFLICYRAFCFEAYRKKHQYELFRRLIADARIPKTQKTFLKKARIGAHLALQDTARILRKYHSADLNNLPCSWTHTTVSLDNPVPVCFSGATSPHFDLSGNKIFSANPLTAKWSPVSLFLGTIAGKTFLTAGGFQEFGYHKISNFITDLSKVRWVNKPAQCINLGLTFVENTFFKISWYESLSDENKSYIIKKRTDNIGNHAGSHEILDFRDVL